MTPRELLLRLLILTALVWFASACGSEMSEGASRPDAVADTFPAADTSPPSDTAVPPHDAQGADDTPPPDAGGAGDTAGDLGREDTGWTPLGIESVSPASGPSAGGTLVMVVGSGFTDSMELRFGDEPARDLFVVDENYLTCATPPGASGFVDIAARRPSDGEEARLVAGFQYDDDLSVASVDPPEGPANGGTPILIEGLGFTPDAVVAVGGRLALEIRSIDEHTIAAVTPPGAAGRADVTVLTHDDTATLPAGFTYRAELRLSHMAPPTGSTLGGERVRIHGSGLALDDPAVTLGASTATVLDADVDGAWLDIETPGAPPGVVDLRVDGETAGTATLTRAFTYIDPSFVTGTPTVHTVVPARGLAAGGDTVTVVATGFPASPEPSVSFDGVPANVVWHDPSAARIEVRTPAHAPGPVTVTVTQEDRQASRADAFTYEDELSVDSVAPPSGPAAGGTAITIQGRGFSSGAQVFVGALPASDVQVLDATRITAVTATGSPGPADVRVWVDGREGRLAGGFEYTTSISALLAIEPYYGSQAGGTFVRVRGLGLPEDPIITIGGQPCRDIVRLSSVEAVGYTPRSEVGTYDVGVTGPDGASLSLTDAFTYFDPTQRSGGTWGRAIGGNINVTVLESGTGFGLAGAAVLVVREDGSPALEGYTDDRGQVTFSKPGLRGPVAVTASKDGYASYSVVEYDAENVTVWLTQQVESSPGFPPPFGVPPMGRVVGRVQNADKYLLIPAGDCADVSVTEPPLCMPCVSDRDCGDGHRCTRLGAGAPYCTRNCETGADCPSGYICRDIGPDVSAQCVPRGGEPEIFCRQSNPSLFGGAPNPGPFADVNQHDEFMLDTDLGELAVYCIAGARTYASGRFEPLVMGVKRHLFVREDEPLADVEVDLDIPVDRDLRILFSDLPYHPSGLAPAYVRAAIHLGSDGYIPLSPGAANVIYEDDGKVARIPGRPRTLSGDLYDASYDFYVSVAAGTGRGLPYSVVYASDVRTVDDDSVFVLDDGGTWANEPTGTGTELTGLWTTSAGAVFATGADGLLYLRSEFGWTQQPVLKGDVLRDIHGAAGDDAWAVGDRGRLLRFNGIYWQTWDAPAERPDFVAVHAAATDAVFAATSGGGVMRFDGSDWTWSRPEDGEPLRDVWAVSGTDAWAVGTQARAYHLAGGGWNAEFVPTTVDLRAVDGAAAQRVLTVGAGGRVFRWDGTAWRTEAHLTDQDLNDVRFVGPTEAYAAGDSGVVLRWSGGNWDHVDTGLNVRRPIRRLAALGDGGLILAGPSGLVMGPFMGFPFFQHPPESGTLPPSEPFIEWYAVGGADPTYNYLLLYDGDGTPVWTAILDGPVTIFDLPPMQDLTGVEPVAPGLFRLSITRALNPAFDIDGYQNSHLSMYRRSTWSIHYVDFVMGE